MSYKTCKVKKPSNGFYQPPQQCKKYNYFKNQKMRSISHIKIPIRKIIHNDTFIKEKPKKKNSFNNIPESLFLKSSASFGIESLKNQQFCKQFNISSISGLSNDNFIPKLASTPICNFTSIQDTVFSKNNELKNVNQFKIHKLGNNCNDWINCFENSINNLGYKRLDDYIFQDSFENKEDKFLDDFSFDYFNESNFLKDLTEDGSNGFMKSVLKPQRKERKYCEIDTTLFNLLEYNLNISENSENEKTINFNEEMFFEPQKAIGHIPEFENKFHSLDSLFFTEKQLSNIFSKENEHEFTFSELNNGNKRDEHEFTFSELSNGNKRVLDVHIENDFSFMTKFGKNNSKSTDIYPISTSTVSLSPAFRKSFTPNNYGNAQTGDEFTFDNSMKQFDFQPDNLTSYFKWPEKNKIRDVNRVSMPNVEYNRKPISKLNANKTNRCFKLKTGKIKKKVHINKYDLPFSSTTQFNSHNSDFNFNSSDFNFNADEMNTDINLSGISFIELLSTPPKNKQIKKWLTQPEKPETKTNCNKYMSQPPKRRYSRNIFTKKNKSKLSQEEKTKKLKILTEFENFNINDDLEFNFFE